MTSMQANANVDNDCRIAVECHAYLSGGLVHSPGHLPSDPGVGGAETEGAAQTSLVVGQQQQRPKFDNDDDDDDDDDDERQLDNSDVSFGGQRKNRLFRQPVCRGTPNSRWCRRRRRGLLFC
jgi:hypothetical protein